MVPQFQYASSASRGIRNGFIRFSSCQGPRYIQLSGLSRINAYIFASIVHLSPRHWNGNGARNGNRTGWFCS